MCALEKGTAGIHVNSTLWEAKIGNPKLSPPNTHNLKMIVCLHILHIRKPMKLLQKAALPKRSLWLTRCWNHHCSHCQFPRCFEVRSWFYQGRHQVIQLFHMTKQARLLATSFKWPVWVRLLYFQLSEGIRDLCVDLCGNVCFCDIEINVILLV